MKGQRCIKRSAPLGLVLPRSAGNTLKFQRDNKAPYVFQGGSDGIGEPRWLRLMCVQTTARRCPLTTLPAGNLFLFKIWVNSRRYTSPRASSNTVGPEHVFNFHALNFKCGPFWHILAVHDKEKKKEKERKKMCHKSSERAPLLLETFKTTCVRFNIHGACTRYKSEIISCKCKVWLINTDIQHT